MNLPDCDDFLRFLVFMSNLQFTEFHNVKLFSFLVAMPVNFVKHQVYLYFCVGVLAEC